MSLMSTAGGGVRPHLRLLRAVGFCRLLRGGGRWGHLHAIYCGVAFAVTSGYVLQQAIYAYQVSIVLMQERSDMEKLSRVLFVMLCHVTCVTKQLVFHLDAHRIDQLIEGLDAASFAARCPRAARQLRAAARGAARLLAAYAGCAVATCLLWGVFPVLDRLHGRHVHFPFWTFLGYDRPHTFAIVLSHSFYATNLVAVGNTTMDAFIATVLNQCKTQLRILRMNFENLPERAKELTREHSVANYEATLTELFVDGIKHFQQISEMMVLLESVFGLAILVQFGVGGWILCMAAYKIVSVNVLSLEFASTTLFIVCILVELFLYCYYGNEVTVESSLVLQSLYGMQWLRTPVLFRRSLVLTMERAKRPLAPAAGHIIPLSLDTFVTVLKSSYSFYAVLRQTK